MPSFVTVLAEKHLDVYEILAMFWYALLHAPQDTTDLCTP